MTKVASKAKDAVKRLAGSADGKSVLGHVIWWTIERSLLGDAKVFNKAFDSQGFGEEIGERPQVVDEEVALTRAHWRVTGMKELDGWIVRKIFLGAEKIVYGMVKETIDEKNEDLKYRKEDKVTLNRNTEEVVLENNLPEGKLFKKLYHDFLGKIDNNSVSLYLRKKMRMINAIQLREMGGVYFVPNTYSDILFRIEKALQESTPESILYVLPIYNDDRSNKSLKTAFAEDFENELKQMKADLEERIGSDKTRESTLKARLDMFKDLRNRAKMYEDLLKFKANDIGKAIFDMEKTVTKALTDVSK